MKLPPSPYRRKLTDHHPLDRHAIERMRGGRIAAGLGQYELGQLLGVSKTTICHRETGRNLLTSKVIAETAKALNVPVTYFYEGYEGE